MSAHTSRDIVINMQVYFLAFSWLFWNAWICTLLYVSICTGTKSCFLVKNTTIYIFLPKHATITKLAAVVIEPITVCLFAALQHSLLTDRMHSSLFLLQWIIMTYFNSNHKNMQGCVIKFDESAALYRCSTCYATIKDAMTAISTLSPPIYV